MSPLQGPLEGTTRSEVGGLTVDEMPAGTGRLKRLTYPPGWSWTKDMQSLTGTPRCQHAHVGYVVSGTMEVAYADGCTARFDGPAFAVVQPDHDGWVVGDEPVVFVQFDHGPDTVERFGLTGRHQH